MGGCVAIVVDLIESVVGDLLTSILFSIVSCWPTNVAVVETSSVMIMLSVCVV